jgi:hypothetical protein
VKYRYAGIIFVVFISLYCLYPCPDIAVLCKYRLMHNNITLSILLALCYSDLFQLSKGKLHGVRHNSSAARSAKYVADVEFGLVISVCYITRQLHDSEFCGFLQYICYLHMWPRTAGFTPMDQNLICPKTRAPSHRSATPRLLDTQNL